jgi:hypothetical protein
MKPNHPLPDQQARKSVILEQPAPSRRRYGLGGNAVAVDLMPSPGMILCGDPTTAFAQWLGHIDAGRIGVKVGVE